MTVAQTLAPGTEVPGALVTKQNFAGQLFSLKDDIPTYRLTLFPSCIQAGPTFSVASA